MVAHKKTEVESSSTTMKELTRTVTELSKNVNQLSATIAQLQENLLRMDTRMTNLKNNRRKDVKPRWRKCLESTKSIGSQC